VRAWLVWTCALAAAACAQAGPPPPAWGTAAVATDTLRGTVEVVGSEPGTSVALLMDGGARAVTLVGERPLLDRLAGLEVAVWGAPLRPGVFRVERVAVRASGGVPALDGVLAREGGVWMLVAGDGRRTPVPHLPPELQAMPGAHVWLTGPTSAPPQSYGIIAPPP
jgi:hypothetical protein